MTNPDIRISTDEVRNHARMVDQAAAILDEAVAGAAYLRASNESYGKLVGPYFTTLLNPVQDYAIDEMRHAVSKTQQFADLLEAMAADLDATDAAAARRLEGGR